MNKETTTPAEILVRSSSGKASPSEEYPTR